MVATRRSAYIWTMDDVGRLLGRRLRAIRESLEATQEDFARSAGINQGYLSRLENGHGWKSITFIYNALEQAGADPADLLREKTPAKPAATEIRSLLDHVDDKTLDIVLYILRSEASATQSDAG